MPNAANLAMIIKAQDEASPVLNRVSSNVEGFGSKMSGFGAALGTGMVAAGAAIAAGLAVGVKSAGDLEQAIANISTIKPEIDNSAVFASLNEMSTRIPSTAAELGESLYNVFSSMDVGASEGLALVEKFAKGAAGAGTSAETFGTAAMGVMNAYGLSVKDADHVSDVFFNTVNKGVITGQELATSLGPVTQSAKAAGVGLDELGAMIAAVTKEGGPAAQNVNNLNNFLQKITTKDAQAELEALGIKTKTATGEFRPTADVLTDLKAKLGGMTEAARANALQEIFPDAQARIGAQTLLSQLDLVKSATEENRTASGSTAAAYEKMSATFNSQSKLLMNSLMAILTTIGGALLPIITPLVTAFAQSLPVAFAIVQEALGPFLEGLTSIGKYLMAVLQDGDYLNDWLASVPEGMQPFILGIGEMISAIQSLLTLFGGSEWDDASTSAYENLVQIFGPDATNMLLEFVNLAMGSIEGLASFIAEQFGVVVSWVQENWPLIQETVQTVLTAISEFWMAHGDQIIEIVTSAWGIVKAVIAQAIDVVLSAVRIGMQLINGDVGGAMETTVGLFTRTFERIGTVVSEALDGMVALIDIATGGMLTSIGNWMTQTQESISSGMDSVSTEISTGWESVKTFVGNILPTITAAIMTVWNALPEDIRADLVLIANHIVTQGAQWVTNLTTAGANMLTAITTALGNMVTAVTTWATSTFLTPIIGLALTAGAAMTAAGSNMLTAITTKLAEIITAITTWADSTFLAPLRGLVGTAQTEASAVGTGIVHGITNAISAGIGTIRDMAYRAARAAVDAAKSALGIESPSKVFRIEVGQQIVKGLMQGVESMQQPLDRLMGGIVQTSSVQPLTAGAFSGGVAGTAGGYGYQEILVRVGDVEAARIYAVGKDLNVRIRGER